LSLIAEPVSPFFFPLFLSQIKKKCCLDFYEHRAPIKRVGSKNGYIGKEEEIVVKVAENDTELSVYSFFCSSSYRSKS
jgi:hypothetical protein